MDRRIKVLQFPIANSFGGITHYALDNWKWIDKSRFQFDFATMSKKLDFAEEILKTGSKIHYISCYAEENREQFIQEFNQILDEGYDVVHLHTKQWKSFLVEELCRKRGIPKIIVHSHSTQCDANDEIKRLAETKEHYRVRKAFSEELATDFWACSGRAAGWLYGEQIPKNKIRIMKNAIDISKFIFDKEKRERLRKELQLQDKYVIGNVGRMVYQKNQDFLIEVFAKIYQNRPDARLLIIGDGALEERLREQIKELQLESCVWLMGKREDVCDIYQAMDMFLLPSHFEGLGIALIEAQTAGLKCFASTEVPEESDVSGNVRYMPLDSELWSDAILKEMKEYERKDMTKVITDAGYNIREQIKVIEEGYANKEE